MRFYDDAAVTALGPAAAVHAVVDALRAGLDPAGDPARIPVELHAGQLLLMPAQTSALAGVKVATVAPDNPVRGLPRIQGLYLLFDADTLAPLAVLDGIALTALRTPAVSVAAVLGRLPDRPLHVVLVGAGPQAVAHAATLAAVRPLAAVTYLVRDPSRAPVDAVAIGSAAAAAALRSADVVVCATSARAPVFDSALLGDEVVVVAVGSHEPDARELDAALMGRATVVVEDVATALREAGDVVLGVQEGALRVEDLVPMASMVAGAVDVGTTGPLVFKSVGMAWQDLVVAAAVVHRPESRFSPNGSIHDSGYAASAFPDATHPLGGSGAALALTGHSLGVSAGGASS